MTETSVDIAKRLLAEADELQSSAQSKLSPEYVSTAILERVSLKEGLRHLLDYHEGFVLGNKELTTLLLKLLALTRPYTSPTGAHYLNLKPGAGMQFQALLSDISEYMTREGLL